MTKSNNSPSNGGKTPAVPDSSISLENLAGVRVRPAQFAAMMGVSRQTVTEWKQKGWITLGSDGRLDPAKAAKQAYANMNPARMKAHVMRDAVEERAELEEEVEHLRRQLEERRTLNLDSLAEVMDAAQIEIAAVSLFNEFTDDPLYAIAMADAALWALWNAWGRVAPDGLPLEYLPSALQDDWGIGIDFTMEVARSRPAVVALLDQVEARRVFWVRDSEGVPQDADDEDLSELG